MQSLFFHLRGLFVLLTVGATLAAHAEVLYVPVADGNAVKRVSTSGAVTNFVTNQLVDPVAIIFDVDGNAYVSDSNGGGSAGVIRRYAAGNNTPTTLASNLNGPAGLAFDANGVLYAALSGEDRIIKFLNPAAPTTYATLATGASPQGIAFDDEGTLFVAEKGTNTVSAVSLTSIVTLFSDEVTAPTALVFEAGSIIVTDAQSSGRIARLNPQGKANTDVDILGDIRGLVYDRIGNAYITTANDNALKQVAVNKTVTGIATDLLAPGMLALRGVETIVVAQKNETLTTDPVGAQFASFGSPAMNKKRTVAFRAKLVSGIGGVSAGNNIGLWLQPEDFPRQLIARTSFPAAGLTGPVWSNFSDPVLNGDDLVAFRGTMTPGIGGITTANAVGLWAGTVGNLQLVAQKGAPAPGTPNGVRFGAFKSFALPDQSGLIFVAKIAGSGVTLANNIGLWAVDLDGNLQLLQRIGNDVTIDDKRKTIASFTILEPVRFAQGQSRHFTSVGEVVYLARFTDGTSAILRAMFP